MSEPKFATTMKGYHPTREEGRWYVASPSGQTIVAGWFDSEEAALEYARVLNARAVRRSENPPPHEGDA